MWLADQGTSKGEVSLNETHKRTKEKQDVTKAREAAQRGPRSFFCVVFASCSDLALGMLLKRTPALPRVSEEGLGRRRGEGREGRRRSGKRLPRKSLWASK